MIEDALVLSDSRALSNSGLEAQAAIYRLLVESAIDVIIRYSAQGIRTYVSPSSSDVLGYAPREMLGKHASELLHPEDFAWADPHFRKLGPKMPCLDLTFRVIRGDGRLIWVEAKHRYLAGDGGAVAVFRDVTSRKEAEDVLKEANRQLASVNEQLRTLAQQDGLTGIANRRRFDELLDEEFRRARRLRQPLGVVLVDVDHFKSFNDRYGHIAGDDCLRRVARGIEAALRRSGERVARYGGEEFVVLVPNGSARTTRMVAERVQRAVASIDIEHRGSPFGRVTVSAGASALIPLDQEKSTDLVGEADRALYLAKSAGRNCARSALRSAVPEFDASACPASRSSVGNAAIWSRSELAAAGLGA